MSAANGRAVTGRAVTGRAVTESPPDLAFAVSSIHPVRHAAVPMVALELTVTERAGRPVYMAALSLQLTIEPARRSYDAATRERLVDLFGAPERWAVTTHTLVWTTRDVVVAAFRGQTAVSVEIPCSYDLELAAARYLHALPDGSAPMALHPNGMVYYPDADGRLQVVLIPWSTSIDLHLPVAVWREAIEQHTPGTGWATLRADTIERLQQIKTARGLPTLDACVAALLDERAPARGEP
jgi:hypothetical protein